MKSWISGCRWRQARAGWVAITVESTRDKEFLDVLRKAIPEKELADWFHIFDAAPVVPLGQRT